MTLAVSTVPAADKISGALRPMYHGIALARRGLIKTMRTPEALIDVTVQPVIFLVLFTYLFGGAVTGSQHDTCNSYCRASCCNPCCSDRSRLVST
jgi:oleandomycin transport system permease protein